MATKKKAAPKKAAKKSKKVVAVPVAEVAPVPKRSVAQIVDDARKPGGEKFEGELIEASDVGSVFTRVQGGWSTKFVDGGTTIFGSGPTIREAILSHGQQIDHEAAKTPAVPAAA